MVDADAGVESGTVVLSIRDVESIGAERSFGEHRVCDPHEAVGSGATAVWQSPGGAPAVGDEEGSGFGRAVAVVEVAAVVVVADDGHRMTANAVSFLGVIDAVVDPRAFIGIVIIPCRINLELGDRDVAVGEVLFDGINAAGLASIELVSSRAAVVERLDPCRFAWPTGVVVLVVGLACPTAAADFGQAGDHFKSISTAVISPVDQRI